MASILTVLTPLGDADLVTVADLKRDLGIMDASGDAQLAAYITAASRVIAARCRRVLAREEVSEAFRIRCPSPAPEPAPLRLRRYPVDPATVVVEESALPIAVGSWELDADAGLIWRLDAGGERRAWASGSVTITYFGGYELPSAAPEDLSRACTLLVNQFRFASPRDPTLKAESIEGIGRQEFWIGSLPSSASGIPAEADALIAPYRAFPLA